MLDENLDEKESVDENESESVEVEEPVAKIFEAGLELVALSGAVARYRVIPTDGFEGVISNMSHIMFPRSLLPSDEEFNLDFINKDLDSVDIKIAPAKNGELKGEELEEFQELSIKAQRETLKVKQAMYRTFKFFKLTIEQTP